MKSALLRKSILTLGIAVTTLALTPSEARAGGAELKKLETELGKTVGSASTTELITALTNLISSSTINAAVVTGEALKGATSATAADFGSELAELLNAGTFPEVTSTNLAKFIGQASKTAATGKIPNTLHLTDFSAGVLSDDNDNAAALAAAKAAIGSKTAAGIILGGRALGLSDDEAEALALSSLADKSLKSAAQATSQYVGDTVSDIVDFTLALSSPAANLKLIKSIAPGAAAASPSEADDIVEALFDTAATQITTRSIAPALAKSVASVADPEVVTFIAITMGEEIQAGNISFKKVNSIAKGLTQGLVLSPVNNVDFDDAAVRFSTTNKLDEIGEVGAYLINAIATRPEFDSAKKAPTVVINLIKSMIKAAKIKAIAGFQLEAGDDVTGSVLQTIVSLSDAGEPFADVIDAIRAKFGKPSTAKSIGGKNAALVAAINGAITKVLGGTAGTAYEDGTIAVFLPELTNPETDNRNG